MDNTRVPIIISLGGSLVVPDAIDTTFLKAFKAFIVSELQEGLRFVIIVGGGKTARNYQRAAHSVTPLTSEDLDWLGIHSTRLNAHLLRAIFHEYAHPEIFTHPEEVPADATLVIAAGSRPGASTDLRAVEIAQRVGTRRIANLTNVDYVYAKDPNAHKDAEPIHEAMWHDFRKLLPEQWDPGLSAPFDPVAAREAEKLGCEVAIMNGTDLSRLKNYIEEKPFIGTIVR